MRKILFGTIVFFSLAFLAACGGGGSGSSGAGGTAGAKGDAGDKGDTGLTGSITVFQDTNLVASFNSALGAFPGSTPTAVPLDSGAIIGSVSGYIAATGLDNLTAGSRNRYYVYTETSTGIQSLVSGEVGGTQIETLLNGIYNIQDDGIFDSRVCNTCIAMNTLANWVLVNPVTAADGVSKTTAYFSVCPGNEAGDGACSKVLAPAYDRGIGTLTAIANADGTSTAALAGSITYAGSSFHVLSDNATGGGVITAEAAIGYRFSAPKSGSGAVVSQDNTSGAVRPASLLGLDNDTRVSNIITRGTNVWFAMAADNATALGAASDGDNASLVVRANGTAAFTDNGSFKTDHAALTTAPQIADSGDGVYAFLGAGAAISAYNVRDNGTVSTLGAITQIGAYNNWCSTSSGVSGSSAIVVSDNNTNGWVVDQVLDNGTTNRLAGVTNGVTNDQDATSYCAVTYLGGTYYLAVSDVTTAAIADNVSVWSSTDATTWAQIGTDITVSTDTVRSLAITTTGTTAADTAVWVAVNDGGNVRLLHYEDIAGGSTNVWRDVGFVLAGAGDAGSGAPADGVSIATDGTSIIAVEATVSGVTNVQFWYNQ